MAKRLYVVGLGPGDPRYFTGQARAALEDAQVLCGYTVYVELIRGLYPDKEIYTTPMTREIDRCRWALEAADGGRTVALVCSGDAGVYGMAGPVLQLAPRFPEVEVEVVPGVTSALSGGALLGAPVGHDFCVISLSDLLTPWAVIENRLRCAAAGDFTIVLYNPASHKRPDYLRRACGILLDAGVSPGTVCGYVRNTGRAGEERHILPLAAASQDLVVMTPLAELGDAPVDMFSTVFIGSSSTAEAGGRMITPRGYEGKRGL